MSNQKSWARLRAILSNATIAAVSAGAIPATAAEPSPVTESSPERAWPRASHGQTELEELARQLALRLNGLPELQAVGTAADLATSDLTHERLVLARALAWAFPLPADDILLAHLADDPDARVRAAVARAAWARIKTVGDTGILRQLLGDADPEVRSAAWLAVRG